MRVNQTGYLPHAPKRATVAVDVTTPLAWTLYDGSDSARRLRHDHGVRPGRRFGRAAAASSTSRASGRPGTGYTLEVYGERSYPFDIADDVYAQLKYDALAYFYHNRSGIEITMPFAGEAQWTRAGRPRRASAPTRATSTCRASTRWTAGARPGSAATTRSTPSEGWYDAGDHGKYVVNGGIAVWTMLDQYERALRTPTGTGGRSRTER